MTDQLPNNQESQPDNGEPTSATHTSGDASDGSGSMLRNAFWCVLVAAGASLFYGLKIESSLFRAIALQLLLAGIAVWSAMDAVKLRRRISESAADDALAVKREATAIHYLFVAAPLVAVVVLSGLSMVGQLAEVAVPRSQQQVVGGAILAVLAASLWTVLARVVQQHSSADEPLDSPTSSEAVAVRAALSESRLAALLSGAALMAATVHPPVEGSSYLKME